METVEAERGQCVGNGGGKGFGVAGTRFAFAAGATIHTENSHKYGYRDSRLLLRAAGWGLTGEWTDPSEWFSIILAEAEPPRFAP